MGTPHSYFIWSIAFREYGLRASIPALINDAKSWWPTWTAFLTEIGATDKILRLVGHLGAAWRNFYKFHGFGTAWCTNREKLVQLLHPCKPTKYYISC